jgi:hypothetical protein
VLIKINPKDNVIDLILPADIKKSEDAAAKAAQVHLNAVNIITDANRQALG